MASERETSIDFMADENFMIVYTCEKKYIRRLKELKEKYPKKVKVLQDYEDCMTVKCPKAWFKFPKPKAKRNFTEEQRQAAAERLRGNKDKVK